jgi:hypothetical protein
MSKSRLPPVPPGNRAPMGGAGSAPGGERNARATAPGKHSQNRNPAAEAGQGKLRASSLRPGSKGR